MVPLCSKPGSRKCTWSSIIPGIRYAPLASSSLAPLGVAMLAVLLSMRSSRIFTSPSVMRPSLTMRAFLMTVMDMADLQMGYVILARWDRSDDPKGRSRALSGAADACEPTSAVDRVYDVVVGGV